MHHFKKNQEVITMKIKKIILVIGVVFLTLILFAACIKEEDEGHLGGGAFKSDGTGHRKTIEEITELIQNSYFDKDGKALMGHWGRYNESKGYYYCSTFPAYMIDEVTGFSVSLLKDVQKPQEYNYYLVEFEPQGHITGELTDKGLQNTWFFPYPSPFKLFKVPEEDRYAEILLSGIHVNYMKVEDFYLTLFCAPDKQQRVFNWAGESTPMARGFYVEELGFSIGYDLHRDRDNDFHISGGLGMQEKVEKLNNWLEIHPFIKQQIESKVHELIRTSDYAVRIKPLEE